MTIWLTALLACSGEGDDPKEVHSTVEHTFEAPYAREGTDVVLIVLDTLRADHLSQYGYDLDTSPGLAGLAAVSTRFESAWAPSPWTLPSTTSIHTGLHPLRHGMRQSGDVLGAEARPAAERLREAGWHTGGFSHNVAVSPRHGFDQGFDAFTHNTGKVLGYPNARRMTRAASEWLTKNPTGPAFVYLQPMNCHGPYKVPATRDSVLLGRKPEDGFRYYQGYMQKILRGQVLSARERVGDGYLRSLREQYDTAIRYETDEVGAFLDQLKAAGRFDNALIVLTADHGEELFEHGGFSHGYSLHAEVLHVPLFVKLPGQTVARVVPDSVSLTDVLPTILEVTGVAAAAGEAFDGSSLQGLAEGGSRPTPPLVFDVGWKRRIVGNGLSEGGWKLLEIVSNYEGLEHATKLYDVLNDPGEVIDLASQQPERVGAMHERLAGLLAALNAGAAVPENHMSEEDRTQLEALGYLE
ncbi:hypothetical protein LBMAG42_08130 [Deltaproteobacteria bacterium]|nr:hypothetical protein LBMAG42_08130 [Deltaproteobacteria bacterium]